MNWVLAAPAEPRRREKGAAYAGVSEALFGWAAVVQRRRWRGERLPERGGEGACARAGQRARMKGLVCTRSLLTRTCTGAVRLQPPPPLLWAAAASAAAAHPPEPPGAYPGRPATGPVAQPGPLDPARPPYARPTPVDPCAAAQSPLRMRSQPGRGIWKRTWPAAEPAGRSQPAGACRRASRPEPAAEPAGR